MTELPSGITLTCNEHGRRFIDIDHPSVRARVAEQGAQIIDCVPCGQRPLLWMSPVDPARPDTALRGGIPLCWPWFADERPGPAHGIARTSHWQLRLAQADAHQVRLVLELPEREIARQLPDERWAVQVEMLLGASLSVTLITTNTGSRAQQLSQALHSYLPVDDIASTEVLGLQGVSYIDKLQADAVCREQEPIRFSGELDRVYFDTAADVQLIDASAEPLWVQRRNSQSVVVWNPWQEKGARLSQFPAEGYRSMVCIEAANAGPDARLLEPGQVQRLQTIISRHPPERAAPVPGEPTTK
ncbi:D-hexose-6-phosphate mutarotase [Pseudomonas sp. MYb185]|uniref:D-hexose-6-phosphate mutarotase n=1 Tax=Pseudomonas sp. MYb185 TaxID=1848729 RepID=UPI000CFB60F1|nr:D-hexose-6-phosphate mutarotase [Pseudomonas sp. MYb185]PRB76163.1 D-hexose-6-phosphate mutarotase [Pseudomonas sp. MYb185]